MPKVKTNSSAKKRFKVTGTGKITWTLASYDDGKNKKITNTVDASRTSTTTCPAGVPSMANMMVPVEAMIPEGKDRTYPNPVQNRVIVETDLRLITEKDVRIIDLQGREMKPASVRKISATRMELDLSNLTSGQYYIRMSNQAGMKVFRIMKQ